MVTGVIARPILMNSITLIALALASAAVLAGCTTNTNDDTEATGSPHGANGAGPSPTRDALIAAYDFKPFATTNDVSAHNTPAHTWLKLDEDRLQFLHWDNDAPSQATAVLFVGDGLRGKFCAGEGGIRKADHDAGFVHFHAAVAPNWDAGHNAGGANGDPSTQGWWLRHVGAVDTTMDMMGQPMQIEKGKVFPMMPADLDSLKACA